MPPPAGSNQYAAKEEMKVKISNTQVIKEAIKQRMDAIEPVFKEAVEEEKVKVVQRTQKGLGVNGRNLKAYSTRFKRNWLDERKDQGLQTSRVDLTFSGAMFEALRVVFKRDGFKFLATIFFDNKKQAAKAKGHQTGQLGRTTYTPRKFFGFSGAQREAIASKIRNGK